MRPKPLREAGAPSSTGRPSRASALWGGEPVKQKLMAAALIFLCAGWLSAQTAGHQRTGVDGDENWVFAAGISIGAAEADYGDGPAIEIDPSFSLEILYKQRFGLSIEVPAVLWLALNREASPRAAAAMGDPSVAAAYTFRLEDWRPASSERRRSTASLLSHVASPSA